MPARSAGRASARWSAKLCRHRAGRAWSARDAHRLGRQGSRGRNGVGPCRGARRDRHRVDECADVGKDQVRAGPAEAAAGRRLASFRSAATITLRSSFRTIRSACSATTSSSRRARPTGRRCCWRTSATRRSAPSMSAAASAAISARRVRPRWSPSPIEWLTKLYGSDVKAAVKRSAVTRWNASPFVLGAISAAAPGAQGVAQDPDGAAGQPVLRRRGGARNAVGHGRRRLGIRRARRGSSAAPDRRAGSGAEAAAGEQIESARSNDRPDPRR